VSVSEVLERLGGVATRATLLRVCDRADVDRALRVGDVVAARGRYSLPAADESFVAAQRAGGVSSHQSAALRHGWEVLLVPKTPQVTVPRHRRLTVEQRRGVDLHWVDLAPSDVRDGATSPDRTLVDCLRLPFAEALAIADSALRHGLAATRLTALGAGIRGPGAKQARRVAQLASARAANPFESGLRAIAVDIPGLAVEPQVSVFDPHFLGRPDLVDMRLGVALEADSFEWHGGRAALARDCRRYNALVAAGWLVLRFAWEDVMFGADEVRAVLEAVVELRTNMVCPGCRAA
jgi:hypothetical protein